MHKYRNIKNTSKIVYFYRGKRFIMVKTHYKITKNNFNSLKCK